MKLSSIPLLERTDKTLNYTGYYEWYCRKDTLEPGRVPFFHFGANKGEALSDEEYYSYLELIKVKKEEMLSRKECYELVRELYGEELDILDCENIIQCSLF